MAKWGEGDPRWIVEERADATNVNNWHWTEKNASKWSREKLKSLLEGLIIEDDCYFCEVKEVTKLEGDASANNRKAKLIFFYEWELEAEWKGKLKSEKTSYKGKFEIPNLSDENSADEVDVIVSSNSSSDEAYKLKDFMHVKGQEKIKEKIATYIRELKEEYSKDLILPTKNSGTAKPQIVNSNSQNLAKKELDKPVLASKSSLGVKINCSTIKDTVDFKCRVSEIYNALTVQEMVKAFSRGPCQLDATTGGAFALFDGNVTGTFTELKLNEKIRMQWRFKTWPDGHYSKVTLVFTEKEDSTEVNLTQTEVPDTDLERTRQGWKNYYWDSIKSTFGFGASLF